jgi:hypothetical protein
MPSILEGVRYRLRISLSLPPWPRPRGQVHSAIPQAVRLGASTILSSGDTRPFARSAVSVWTIRLRRDETYVTMIQDGRETPGDRLERGKRVGRFLHQVDGQLGRGICGGLPYNYKSPGYFNKYNCAHYPLRTIIKVASSSHCPGSCPTVSGPSESRF